MIFRDELERARASSTTSLTRAPSCTPTPTGCWSWPTSTTSARTGASARPGRAARRRCSTRSTEHFEAAGLEDQLHLERFSLELGGDGGEGGTITFRNTGKTVEADGATTVLEAGEEAGIGMPFGCRMGICHTCTLTLVSGHGPRPAQRRRVRPAQRTGADLRHRRRRRLHARHLTRRDPQGGRMAISDVQEYTHLTDEEIEQLGRELDAIRAEIEESRGDDDAAYINRLIRIQRGLAVAGRLTLLLGTQSRKTRMPAAVAGATLLGAGQDPREHGDRPQRHARPVGLDERPRDPLLQLGVGHRPAGRAVEAQPQLRAPPVHQRARLRQRHRLRHPADGPRAEVVAVQPRPAGLQRAAGRRSSSGASPCTTSTSSGSARARRTRRR